MDNQGEIILYQSEDSTQLEVRIENETIWLTQNQIAELFGVKQPAISKHLKNIFLCSELIENSVHSILEYTASDGKRYKTAFYNLDAILSVGYRVNSKNATQFRIWANSILKEYLMKGYVLNSRIDRIEKKIFEHDQKFDLLIKTTLPPNEGIFYDGQIFDAWKFAADLVKSAKKSIVLIDNYIDESVLHLMAKRNKGVEGKIFTSKISAELKKDIEKFNAQYEPVEVKIFSKSHDRFLIIDNETVYHIGASLKDLAKKWFAFSKIELDATEMINKVTNN
ncbi:MAG: virulence RhuM family protein [Paludibacteraceae bacterium]|nr:virulence RhuM family protein [Paludibacteraceae bacterium]